ncbi:MAG: hypothetical protein ACK4OO_05545 [bacterium]
MRRRADFEWDRILHEQDQIGSSNTTSNLHPARETAQGALGGAQGV